ncbi:MAG: extracellular solute-binding protein [Acetobacteraceae bacterium]|nr:extracellular solute-binding protein [Acetobacteraceae bacterium]
MVQGTSRRAVLGGMAGLATAGGRVGAALAAASPPLPSAPVALNVVDVAGQLQLTQRAMDDFVHANPKLVSKISYSQAPAPELPGKLKAQQDAGRVDIDLVLTGTDALSAGVDQKLWVPLLTDYREALPDMNAILQPGAVKMQALAQDQAVCVVFSPAGPLLEYMPDAVKTPPRTAQALLEWTRANPRRFIYARPANSGPGRTFLQGLPYLLGDKDPKDPKDGWAKTWDYLVELGKNIEYYPTGTGAVMKELGEGSRDMIVTMTGWDINPRVLGVVPKEAEVAVLDGFHWVTDGQYMAVPHGVSNDKLAVLLSLINYVLTKPAQATTWDKGYFYPGPAVKDVPLSMAPADSQTAIKEYNRPFYDKLIAEAPTETPLPADRLVYAFSRWDQQVGAKVGK